MCNPKDCLRPSLAHQSPGTATYESALRQGVRGLLMLAYRLAILPGDTLTCFEQYGGRRCCARKRLFSKCPGDPGSCSPFSHAAREARFCMPPVKPVLRHQSGFRCVGVPARAAGGAGAL